MEAVAAATGEFIGVLEDALFEQGVTGIVTPGPKGTEVRKLSTPALIHLLKKNHPRKHGDVQKVEKVVSGQVEHKHTGTVKYEELSTEQRRLVRRLLTEKPSEN